MLKSGIRRFWVQGTAKALRQGSGARINLTLREAEKGPMRLKDSVMRCP